MSMNKTCPISNFTSDEDSDGIKDLFLSGNSAFNEPIPVRDSRFHPPPTYERCPRFSSAKKLSIFIVGRRVSPVLQADACSADRDAGRAITGRSKDRACRCREYRMKSVTTRKPSLFRHGPRKPQRFDRPVDPVHWR